MKKKLIIQESFAIIFLLLGLSFVSFPSFMATFLPYITIFYFLILLIFSIFIYKDEKNINSLIELIAWGILTITLIAFVISPFDDFTTVAFPMMAYCFVLSIRSIIIFFDKKTTKSRRVFLIINTSIHLMLAVLVIYSYFNDHIPMLELITDYGLIYIFDSISLYLAAYTKHHQSLLLKILIKSYAKEILSGLVLIMIIASFLLTFIEPDITSFADGMGYCFALVTTIGFGDYAAVSTPGRVISIFVGVYGILVVSLITSIIVNIYLETKDKENQNNKENNEGENSEKEES